MPFARLLTLSLLLLVAACASQPKRPVVQTPAPPAGPTAPGGVKIGKPYQVFGRTYVPADDRSYDEVGIASWYGPTFHAKATATGEIYNQDDVTAAHKTLPMPSWVEVTNLDNGRKLVVRVNDRGPFVDGRIIDLSRRSAQLLGVDGPGLARVRVRRVFPEGDWARNQEARPLVIARAPVPQPAPALVSPPVPAPAETFATAGAAPSPVRVDLPPAPAATPAAAGSFIQVAALSDEGRARALASVLADFGPAAAVPAPNGLWRVRIGPLPPERAPRLLGDVQAAGYADARIVR
jgi:rare lipoprotein A